MTAKEYTQLLSSAKRIAHDEQEAQDLLQEALIVAIKENRLDFSLEENQKWLFGVMRNKVLQEARTYSRRRKRDQAFTSARPQESVPVPDEVATHSFDSLNNVISTLPPAARKVAVLVIHGLDRSEICSLLNLSSTAFRQRLTTIRKALGPLPPGLQQEVIALAYASRYHRDARASALPVGLMRKALLKSLQSNGNEDSQSVGTHDPSGHLIVVSPKHQKK